MPHHFTKDTTEAAIFCNKCMKETMWRIADGRRQWCIACYEKQQSPEKKKEEPPQDIQQNLFN